MGLFTVGRLNEVYAVVAEVVVNAGIKNCETCMEVPLLTELTSVNCVFHYSQPPVTWEHSTYKHVLDSLPVHATINHDASGVDKAAGGTIDLMAFIHLTS